MRKLRKGRISVLNLYLGTFFLFVVAGLSVNILYAVLANVLSEAAYTFLNRLSSFLICFAIIFILYFTIALKKGIAAITPKWRGIFFGAWILITGLLLFVGQSTLVSPGIVAWDPILGWYSLGVILGTYVLILYYSFEILKVISDRSLKFKFGAFVIGMTVLFAGLISTVLTHMALFPSLVSALILAIGILPAGYMIYYGIDKVQQAA
ncbi:MAG TPA: hypothetical protein VKK79_17290 [Candidatus Lokiarchaeia archaeon]|nr:hypothetical protein [Candidatus Lokiarchaeia archaeon]